MSQEFIIADNTIKYGNGSNPLNERLLYGGAADQWSRNMELAKKYLAAESAIVDAKILYADAPVKIFVLDRDGNQFRLGELAFQI